MNWNKTEEELGKFDLFRSVVAALRAEDGCPWDRAQTFESLKPCLINETTEAVAAADIYRETGNAENLCEELGDVLLQVVLQAQIAQEEGLFDMEDVIRGISRKMIRRHPHVFGDVQEGTALKKEEVPGRWEEIKKKEKGHRTPEMEQQEREAFSRASVQIIRHLEEKEKRKQENG